MHFRNSAIVHNKIIGGDNWAAFFEIFDFALIAFTDFGFVKGSFGTDGDAGVAKWFRSNNSNKSKFTGEFMF